MTVSEWGASLFSYASLFVSVMYIYFTLYKAGILCMRLGRYTFRCINYIRFALRIYFSAPRTEMII